MSAPPRTIYRREAVERATGPRGEGDVLRLAPGWTRAVYPILVAAFLVGLVYAAVGTVHEYAAGPAVVWVAGRTHLTAAVSGTVASIEVAPGQKVAAGQVLVRFASRIEVAELGRIDRAFEIELAKTLRDPSDQAARAALTALRTEREVAAARLDQLAVRAPRAGSVGDIRIRVGQLLQVGDVVLTLGSDAPRFSVLAMLPAHYRPQLRPGMSLRFEVSGYRYAYQEMTITQVGEQIIGPAEVKRYLGQELADTVEVEGPVVLVEASPRASTFHADGQSFDFYHGMRGLVEARVRTRTVLVVLIPALRVLFEALRD